MKLIGKIIKVIINILFWFIILAISMMGLMTIWKYYKKEVIGIFVTIILLCIVGDKYEEK